jgi:hypothetical protein
LNKLIKLYFTKVIYINNILKFESENTSEQVICPLENDQNILSNFIKVCILYLTEYIIFDPIIENFIENNIINFVKSSHIKILIDTLSDYVLFDNYCLYKSFIKKIGLIFKKETSIILDTTDPVPNNLKLIVKLNNIINYYRKIETNYYYISNDIKYYVILNIYTIFLDLFENNTISDISFVFDIIWSQLQLIFHYDFENKENVRLEFITQIIKHIKNIAICSNNKNDILCLINILKHVDLYIQNIIVNKDILISGKEIVIEEFNKLFESDDNFDIIFNIINDEILNLNEHIVTKILNYIVKINNQEKIVTKYYDYLVKRLFHYILLPDTQKYLKLEYKFYNILKSNILFKLIYKIQKVIHDTELSLKCNIEYFEKNYQFNKKYTTIITSYNIWPINYSDGLLTPNLLYNIDASLLGKYILEYDKYYTEKYNNKKLIWFPHYGEINITYLNQTLIMLPIQFMIIEMFTNTNIILETEIISASFLTNYSDKFKNDLLHSIILSKVLIKDKDNIILCTNKDIHFKNNLIEIFYTESKYYYEQKQADLSFKYVDITVANINHVLKYFKLNYDDLFNQVKTNITVFSLTKETFDNALKYMFESDYIKYNNSLYEKIYY